MKNLSLSTRRIIAGAALALSLLCAANFYFDFKFFGGFDKQVMVVSFVILGLSQLFFGATPGELRQHRDSKRSSDQ